MRDREAVHSRGFQSFFAGIHAILVGRDDQHGVVTGDGSCDFREFRAIDGGSEGWAPLGGVFRTSRFSADEYQEETRRGHAPGEQRRGFFRERGGRFVARLRFLRAQLLESRERVAWVTRVFCAARRRRNSSWLPIR